MEIPRASDAYERLSGHPRGLVRRGRSREHGNQGRRRDGAPGVWQGRGQRQDGGGGGTHGEWVWRYRARVLPVLALLRNVGVSFVYGLGKSGRRQEQWLDGRIGVEISQINGMAWHWVGRSEDMAWNQTSQWCPLQVYSIATLSPVSQDVFLPRAFSMLIRTPNPWTPPSQSRFACTSSFPSIRDQRSSDQRYHSQRWRCDKLGCQRNL